MRAVVLGLAFLAAALSACSANGSAGCDNDSVPGPLGGCVQVVPEAVDPAVGCGEPGAICCDPNTGKPVDGLCQAGQLVCNDGSGKCTLDGHLLAGERCFRPGASCVSGFFCGSTAGFLCGQGAEQRCVLGPTDCGEDAPVCGCEGTVYPNRCAAVQAGVDISAMGSCTTPADHFVCGPFFCRNTGEACVTRVSKLATYACEELPDGCHACDCAAMPTGCKCGSSGSGTVEISCEGL